eukprot:maker-scaffold_24-snap-gene-4.33-mRNA-1 protein AED:0.12 eAED:0.13 QI:81/0.66/0.5/1/0.33/0/4/0/352
MTSLCKLNEKYEIKQEMFFQRFVKGRNIDALVENMTIDKVEHVNHIDFDRDKVTVDSKAKNGLANIPKDYDAALEAAGLSKEEIMENKDKVLNILQLNFEGLPKVPTTQAFQRNLDEVFTVTPGDPEKILRRVKKLGQGGQGKVLLCVDTRTNTEVAVKVSDSNIVEEIKQEIAMQAMSKHKNVVKVFDIFVKFDEYWIVIELMSNSLVPLIPLDWNEKHLAYVFRETLQGLESLHSRHRLHRDIKPDNILWNYSGQIKLADFGIEPMRAMMLISKSPSPKLNKKNKWSIEFNSFVDRCVKKDPKERAESHFLLIHPFIGSAARKKSFSKWLEEQRNVIEPKKMGPPKKKKN